MLIRHPLFLLSILCILAVALSAISPVDSTLGANVRIVYLHGALVWAALLGFAIAAFSGLAGIVTRKPGFHDWSRAWGRAGLLFWLVNLPMSLYVMQANWNGLYLSEPRFRFAVIFAIAGLLLQGGLAFLPVWWTSSGNLFFGAALIITVSGAQAVMHPDSPVFSSESMAIRLYFIALAVLLALALWQVARLFHGIHRRVEL